MPKDDYKNRSSNGPHPRASSVDDAFDDEELTPVYGDQLTQALKRASSAAASSKEALRLIGEVRVEVKAYAEKDKEDHDQIHDTIGELHDEIKGTRKDLDDVRVEVAGVSGKIDVLIQGRQQDFERAQLEKSDRLETDRMELNYKLRAKGEIRRTILKVLAGIVLAASTAGITWYFAH